MSNETKTFAGETSAPKPKAPMFRPHQLVFDKETSELLFIVDWPRRTFIVSTREPAYIYRFDRSDDIRLRIRSQADMESGRFEAWANQTGTTPAPKVLLTSKYAEPTTCVCCIVG